MKIKKSIINILVLISLVLFISGCGGETTTEKKTFNVDVTVVSAPNLICTFQRTEVLWSPEMPWDGSYVCRGAVTLDFHGLTFSSDRTLRISEEELPEAPGAAGLPGDFEDFAAKANTPINQVTFNYIRIGGDYFQKDKPDCPTVPEIKKLRLYDLIPDVENPFPTQKFDVDIKMTCP